MASVVYDIKKGETTRKISDAGVVKQLRAMGKNVVDVGMDGKTLTIQGPDGLAQKTTILDELRTLGYDINSSTVMPGAASFDSVSGQLRAVVNKLPNDQMRQAAIEQSLQRMGIHNAQVMGSGRDWYYFDDKSGGYKALTNTPGWDKYDAVEGMLEVPKIAGATLGAGIAGLGSGGMAAVPGAMLGAGIGSGIGDAATRMYLGATSPEYAKQVDENPGAILKDMAMSAGIDAASLGIAKGAGPVVSKLLGTNAGAATNAVMNKGIISPAVKGTGAVIEGTGKGIANGARMVNTSFGRSGAAMAMPGVGEAEVIGDLIKVPGQLIRNSPKIMQKLGSSETLNKFMPDAAGWLRRQGSSLRRAAAPSLSPTQKAANFIGMGAEETAKGPTSGAVLRELANKAGPRGQAFSKTAETIGRGVDNLEAVGRGITATTQGIAGGALKTAEIGGRTAQAFGAGMRRAGTIGSPLESRVALHAGGDALKDEYEQYIERLRRTRARSKMNGTLATN